MYDSDFITFQFFWFGGLASLFYPAGQLVLHSLRSDGYSSVRILGVESTPFADRNLV